MNSALTPLTTIYLDHKPGDFPQSEQAQEQVLTLPMYPELSEEQVGKIVAEIKRATNHSGKLLNQ